MTATAHDWQEWDATQIKRSTARVGAADKKRSGGQIGIEDEAAAAAYDLVMAAEEQIEFISTEMVAGNIAEDGTAAKVEKKDTKMTLADVRKSLPVFPYREDIIAAVHEYQVRVPAGYVAVM